MVGQFESLRLYRAVVRSPDGLVGVVIHTGAKAWWSRYPCCLFLSFWWFRVDPVNQPTMAYFSAVLCESLCSWRLNSCRDRADLAVFEPQRTQRIAKEIAESQVRRSNASRGYASRAQGAAFFTEFRKGPLIFDTRLKTAVRHVFLNDSPLTRGTLAVRIRLS